MLSIAPDLCHIHCFLNTLLCIYHALLPMTVATAYDSSRREPCRDSVCIRSRFHQGPSVHQFPLLPLVILPHQPLYNRLTVCIQLLVSFFVWEKLQSQLAVQTYPLLPYSPVYHLAGSRLPNAFSVTDNSKQTQEHPAHGTCLAPPSTANLFTTTLTIGFFGVCTHTTRSLYTS